MLQNTTKDELEATIRRDTPWMDDSMVERTTKMIYEETDSRLEKNVREWINNVPLSDIVIGDYSINLIMHIRNTNSVLGALFAMNDYIRDPKLGALRIWRHIR